MGALSNSMIPVIIVMAFALGTPMIIAAWFVDRTRNDPDFTPESRRHIQHGAYAIWTICGALMVLFFLTFP